jgi:hypothetical protein
MPYVLEVAATSDKRLLFEKAIKIPPLVKLELVIFEKLTLHIISIEPLILSIFEGISLR